MFYYRNGGGTEDASDKPGDLLLRDLFLASLADDCQEGEVIWGHNPLGLAIAYDSPVFHVFDPQNLDSFNSLSTWFVALLNFCMHVRNLGNLPKE